MRFKQQGLSAALMSGVLFLSSITLADDLLTVYGQINVTLDTVDKDSNGEDEWQINSNASRFGIKGKGAAGDGLEAIYGLEWQVDVTDQSGSKSDSVHIKSRNQFIGLRGNFGEVILGRHDTPFKKSLMKVALFEDLIGDHKKVFNGKKRADNIIQYTSPKLHNFTGKIAFVPGEDTDGNKGDGIADAVSTALQYDKNNLSIGFALDFDIDGVGVDSKRLIAKYKWSGFQFGAMGQTTDVDADNFDGYLLSASYAAGNNTFKIQYTHSEMWKHPTLKKTYSDQTSLGWEFKLAKKYKGYAYYTAAEIGATAGDDSVFGVGLLFKF